PAQRHPHQRRPRRCGRRGCAGPGPRRGTGSRGRARRVRTGTVHGLAAVRLPLGRGHATSGRLHRRGAEEGRRQCGPQHPGRTRRRTRAGGHQRRGTGLAHRAHPGGRLTIHLTQGALVHKAGSQHFQVLRNAAADLGLWPLGATTPAGWRPVGFHGSWERCLAYVATLGATQGAMPGQPAVDAPDPSPFVGAWAGGVARHAGRTAVAGGGLVWSFAELDERVPALVSRLRARGVRGGDQLAVPAAAGAGVVAMLAAVHTGAVAVLPSPFVATTPHRAVDGLGFYDRSDRAA